MNDGEQAPMNEDISINFRWTADELLTSYRWHFRHRIRPLYRYAFWFLIAMYTILGAYGAFIRGSSSSGLLMPFLCLSCVFTIRLLQPWLIRRQFAKRPDRDIEIEWRISPDAIYARSAHGTSNFTWLALAKVVQTPAGFLFYPTEQIFHWLPRHGFASDTDFDRLSKLAEQHATTFHCNA